MTDAEKYDVLLLELADLIEQKNLTIYLQSDHIKSLEKKLNESEMCLKTIVEGRKE